MRLVIQRVQSASVKVEGAVKASIGSGMLVLVGFCETDTVAMLPKAAQKLVDLRIFSDSEGKMNASVLDIKGEILLVPQFTLYAEMRKGNRPSFHLAAEPSKAEGLFHAYVKEVEPRCSRVGQGVFQAHMEVSLINDGPVTLVVDYA